ncbi:hypothetical protein BZA77DRAFT_294983 [Pyronema omphalodes]|nr:hypothetical protein BZA77DRAFT_294983 [Pyronema omphalodes]
MHRIPRPLYLTCSSPFKTYPSSEDVQEEKAFYGGAVINNEGIATSAARYHQLASLVRSSADVTANSDICKHARSEKNNIHNTTISHIRRSFSVIAYKHSRINLNPLYAMENFVDEFQSHTNAAAGETVTGLPNAPDADAITEL